MKEIFDWLRKVVDALDGVNDLSIQNGDKCAKGARTAYRNVQEVITEAEAKWKAQEAELRANVIDEFAEAIMVKATELSEKVVFDGKLVCDALSLDCVSDMVVEIAEQMRKGE